MANEEHLALIKQGAEVWNAWREDNPTTLIDLRGADLSRAKLGRADLSRADLGEADLKGANLLGTNFRGANLSGADLIMADLRRTRLSGANLGRAWLGETVFSNVDLTDTKGLDSCNHSWPSVVDIRTLQQSRGLPLAFLRGCGLPDRLIEYLPSLTDQAIQLYSCFISYSSQDQEFADRLHADLQDNDVRCWFAPEDLKIGDKTWDAIDRAIRYHDKLLLILSEQSIESDWVEDEVTKAFAEERARKQTVLFPLRIDDAVMDTNEPWAVKLRDSRHIGDFREWKSHDDYQASFARVLRDLTAPQEADA